MIWEANEPALGIVKLACNEIVTVEKFVAQIAQSHVSVDTMGDLVLNMPQIYLMHVIA